MTSDTSLDLSFVQIDAAPKGKKIKQSDVLDTSFLDEKPEPIKEEFSIVKELPRAVGRVARNVAAGTAGLADVGLLIPKTAAGITELGLEAAGLEGSGVERFAEKIRSTPPLREGVLQVIDEATGGKLQPRSKGEALADLGIEVLTPATGVGKAKKVTGKAATKVDDLVDSIRAAFDPSSAAARELQKSAPPATAKVIQRATDETPIDLGQEQGSAIRLSKGQRTQDPDIQEFEILAGEGLKGRAAQQQSIAFEAGQQDDIVKAFNSVLDDSVGAADDTPITGAVEEAIKVVRRGRGNLKRLVDNAYEQARDVSTGVKFNSASVKEGMQETIEGSLKERGLSPDKDLNPLTNTLFGKLKKLTDVPEGEADKLIDLDSLENWRKAVTAQANAQKGTPEGVGLNVMKRQYDEFMVALADKAIKEGDTTAINSFRKARGLRARLGSIYESNKIVNRIIKDPDRTTETIVNDIFGSANFKSKTEAATTVKALIKAGGNNKAAVRGSLKEGIVSRLLSSSRGDRVIAGTDVNIISPAKLKTQLNNLLDGNMSLTKELFDPKEITQLRNLQADLNKIKSKQQGVVNPSGSATRILKSLSNLGGFGGIGQTAKDIIITPAGAVRNTGKARKSFENPEELLARLGKELKNRNAKSKLSDLMIGASAVEISKQQEDEN